MNYQTPIEFSALLDLYRALSQRKYVLEIGSMTGDTLRPWIHYGEPGMTMVSVDKIVPPSDSRHAEQTEAHDVLWPMFAEEQGAKLVVVDGYSQDAATIAKVKAAVPYLDFLFIDGGHDYATVQADYENYAPLVKPGGMIAFHDIQGIADVARFWNELKSGKHLSPALSPFASESNAERGEGIVEICTPGGWGIGCLTKPDDRPTLHVITPCSRPENLGKLADSLLPGDVFCKIHWWIVYDHKLMITGPKPVRELPQPWHFPAALRPQIVRGNSPDLLLSVAGKAQINLALDCIEDNGWVWVLDDDNVAHPDFFKEIHRVSTVATYAKAMVFPQLNRKGEVREAHPGMVRECGIDQAQFVLWRGLIGCERYLQKYTADGEFAARIHDKDPSVWLFCGQAVTYYNWLREGESNNQATN